MPAFPIIDTHVHFWDPGLLRYTWTQGHPRFDRPFRIEDYNRDTCDIEIEALVFLECDADAGQSIQEVAFVESEARRDMRLQAVVANVPLDRGSAIEPLLVEMAERFPRVKGVRRILQSERDVAELLQSATFIAGVTLLKRFGLHFELTVNHSQMDSVVEFVKRVPDISMVLDHCGKPDVRNAQVDQFHRHARELARYPNVICKISGLATEADPANWSAATLRPFIEAAFNTFGVDRVMYGSDWPVCLLATSVQRWVATLDAALTGLSEIDRRKFYCDNARRFYRL